MVLDKRKEAMRRTVFGGMLVVCVALLGAVVWAEKAADQHTASGREVILRFPPAEYDDFATLVELNNKERSAA